MTPVTKDAVSDRHQLSPDSAPASRSRSAACASQYSKEDPTLSSRASRSPTDAGGFVDNGRLAT